MKRATRYIINGLTVLSLLLCIGIVALWIWSYSVPLAIQRVQFFTGLDGERLRFAATGGFLVVSREEVDLDRTHRSSVRGYWLAQPKGISIGKVDEYGVIIPGRFGEPDDRSFAGIGWGGHNWLYAVRMRGVSVHLAYPATILAAFPAWCWARKWRIRRRRMIGFCQVCGYDMRATPDRCSECGAGRYAEEVRNDQLQDSDDSAQ